MVKTISLSDDAYEALARLKRSGESFSDVAKRLAAASARRDFQRHRGCLGSDPELADAWTASIRKERDEDDKGRRGA